MPRTCAHCQRDLRESDRYLTGILCAKDDGLCRECRDYLRETADQECPF